MGKSKKAVASFLGQSDTGATERYMHALEPELWEIAKRLEDEMASALTDDEFGGFSGVKSGVKPFATQ